MAQKRSYPVTKYLAAVIAFMNADFGGDAKPRGPWRGYDLENKDAREIQQGIMAVYKRGRLAGSDIDFVNRYVWSELTVGDDGHSFATLRNISLPGSDTVTSFVNVVNRGLFWQLRHCAYQPCSKFFLPKPKQRYCSGDCLAKSNNESAQQRVYKSRKAKRYKAIEKPLRRIRELGKRLAFSELMNRLPKQFKKFDAHLLAQIAEGKEDPRVIAEKVKYNNFKILKGIKL